MAGGVHADVQNQTMTAPTTQTSGTANTTATNTAQNSNNSNSNSQNSTTGNSSNSSQLNAIKAQIQSQYSSLQTIAQPYRQKYQKLPKNDKSQQNALESQFEKQAKPVQKKIAALQKKYVNTMTPKQRKQMQDQQKAAQKKVMRQLQKQMKVQQKQEIAKMMKTAQPIFLIKGHYAYTVDVDNTKKGVIPVPGTMKKYMTLRKFKRLDTKEQIKARLMYQKALRIRNKAVRSKRISEASKLFMKYVRVATINNSKKSNKKNKARKVNRRRKRTTKSNKLKNRVNKSKRSHRKKHKLSHSNKRSSFTVKENNHRVIYLNSRYRRGNYKAVRKSGFANGKILSGNVHTMFSRYLPNNRHAVIPRHYRIYRVNMDKRNTNQPSTVWLVGHHTNSDNKINHMRQAYYYLYNKRYGGWTNVGFDQKN